MAFGALLSAGIGLAGSIFGASQASKTAAAQLAQQQYEFERNREMQGAQMALGLQSLKTQREDTAYQRMIESMNRNIVAQERRYQMSQANEIKDQMLTERQAMIERQIEVDKAAAEQRAFQISQLLQNQSMAQDEREFALAQLKEAQSIASGERDEQNRLLMMDRAKAEVERDFYIQQMQQAQGQFAQERAQDLAIRDATLQQIGGLQAALRSAQSQLGPAPEMAQLTEDEIAAEIERRSALYQSDVDRAADKVASVNEANLIRGGMDESTTGAARRGDVAARLAQEYQNARGKAYDDALKYITGKTQTLDANVSDIMKLRAALLSETSGVEGSTLNYMANLPKVASATGGYSLLSGMPTSIYSRNISSANDYRTPVNIGTGIYDNISIASGLGQTMNLPSAATNVGMSIGSAVFNPYNVAAQNPQNYFNAAANLSNSLVNASAANYRAAQENAITAGTAVGNSLNTFSKELGSWWDGALKAKSDASVAAGTGPYTGPWPW